MLKKVVGLVAFIFAIELLRNIFGPVLTNQMALQQLQNSNDGFTTWRTYLAINELFIFLYAGFALFLFRNNLRSLLKK